MSDRATTLQVASTRAVPFLRTPVAVVALAALLSACGGGGGGATSTDTATTPVTETPQGTGTGTTTGSTGSTEALATTGAFNFKVDASLVDDAALKTAVGGSTYAAWNPAGGSKLLSAGLKVLFFGNASGCPTTTDGAVTAGDDTDLRTAISASAQAATSGNLRRWAPSGQSTGCTGPAKTLSGPSMAYMNPANTQGGVALYTHTGPRADGTAGLMAPFSAAGQNGAGANAYVSGTFVTFRQNWRAANAVRPWVGANQAANASARIVSVQGVGTATVGAEVSADQPIQAKQQISVSFLNTACMASGASSSRPCQVNYMFNTAVYRAGVSDWSTVAWFQNGKIWFDPAQGGTPIVELPVKAAGQVVKDNTYSLPLYVSRGAATQHTSFSGSTFDMRISFDQLQNALRIVTARSLNVKPAQVTDTDMAAQWGAQWNDRQSWVLLSSLVGQEVHNPISGRRAVIGGNLRQLYVGPQI